MRLPGTRILLGVSGSIAAYKSADLIRLLIKEGAEVQVIMTESAHDFIAPLTLGTLSKHPVLTTFSQPESGTWNNHVELGMWADAYIIAPLTANSLAKLAHGYCEDLLSAVYLSARCPVFIAPAMDLDMYAHASTQENIERLNSFGTIIIGPESGELASGLKGEGRMTEPEDICAYIIKALRPDPKLKNKNVLISAGPTREAIDPVRFISNHSSGKMGVALADEMANRGAIVTLVCGPGVKLPKNNSINIVNVISAIDMYNACMEYFSNSDITIMAAAVADFAPAEVADEKIKKHKSHSSIALMPTKDILSEMGKKRNDKQILVGFALETNNELENATAKLKSKNLDLIVLNSLNDAGAGFNTDTNKITIIGKNYEPVHYQLKTKAAAASDIAEMIVSNYIK